MSFEHDLENLPELSEEDREATARRDAAQERREHIAALAAINDCCDVESELHKARALAECVRAVADSPSDVAPEHVGWLGVLLTDTLRRLEIAIEREDAEVSHA